MKNTEANGGQHRHERLPIGARLRELRLARGLSQRAVAQAAGTGHRTVATIERDEISPSVSTLKRIVDCLGLTLSEFFDGVEPGPDERVVYRADQLLELADGKEVSYRQVGRSLFGRNMMILHEKYSPGADTGASYAHEAQEGGIVVRGRICLTVGSERWALNTGDAYYFDSRKPHRFHNPFSEQCEIVSAVSPPTF